MYKRSILSSDAKQVDYGGRYFHALGLESWKTMCGSRRYVLEWRSCCCLLSPWWCDRVMVWSSCSWVFTCLHNMRTTCEQHVSRSVNLRGFHDRRPPAISMLGTSTEVLWFWCSYLRLLRRSQDSRQTHWTTTMLSDIPITMRTRMPFLLRIDLSRIEEFLLCVILRILWPDVPQIVVLFSIY